MSQPWVVAYWCNRTDTERRIGCPDYESAMRKSRNIPSAHNIRILTREESREEQRRDKRHEPRSD